MTSAADRLVAPGSRRGLVVAGALVVAVVLALAVLAVRESDTERRANAAQEALGLARERAEQMTTYTATSFEKDAAWATTGATPAFAEEYAAANAPLAKVVGSLRARATGKVIEASATAVADDEVRVLMFVDQTVTQGAEGKTSTERNRVVMTMVHRDGAWLVDDVALR